MSRGLRGDAWVNNAEGAAQLPRSSWSRVKGAKSNVVSLKENGKRGLTGASTVSFLVERNMAG